MGSHPGAHPDQLAVTVSPGLTPSFVRLGPVRSPLVNQRSTSADFASHAEPLASWAHEGPALTTRIPVSRSAAPRACSIRDARSRAVPRLLLVGRIRPFTACLRPAQCGGLADRSHRYVSSTYVHATCIPTDCAHRHRAARSVWPVDERATAELRKLHLVLTTTSH